MGIGPAAHSYDGRERHWNAPSLDRYLAGEAPEREVLSDRDRFNEYLLTRLRTAEGIDLAEIERLFGAACARRLEKEAQRFVAAGMLAAAERRLAVPPAKFLVSDAVIGALFRE